MLKAEAWRVRDGNKKVFTYRLQTTGADFRSRDKLLEAMKGWRDGGVIIDPTKNTCEFLFSRSFSGDADWLAWAETFPYQLSEISSTSGTVKRKRLGSSGARRKPGRPRKGSKGPKKVRKVTTCGKCGEPGHNARTCGGKGNPANKNKAPKKKRRMCSWCCEYGHNKRTCPELQ